MFMFAIANSYFPPLSIVCTEGEIGLFEGRSRLEGRLEMCVNGVWGTVCDDNFGPSEAIVVCRQLGLETRGTACDTHV